jgi:microcystin-dependent protein
MSQVPQPFVGEIRMFAGNFAPVGWAFCDGALQPITENQTLYQLLGTTYGGDGVNTFALPDLRGRAPLHQGQGPGTSNYTLGERAGVESVALTLNQIPSHSHAPRGQTGAGTQSNPQGNVWAASALDNYSGSPPSVPMAAGALATVGANAPHDNMPPYVCVSFIISLFGIFPTV